MFPSTIRWLVSTVVAFILILPHQRLVTGDVCINDSRNRTREIFRDLPADFGSQLTKDGLTGYLVRQIIPRACDFTSVTPPPFNRTGNVWIALIERGQCDFSLKVLNAQMRGYQGVIVYNNDSDTLLHMGGDQHSPKISIPSVFISRTDGLYIGENYNYKPRLGFTVTIDSEGPLDMNYYLVPFAAVVGCCFLLMLVFMVGKWLRDYRVRNKARVSKKHLRTIPTKKFVKGDQYDLCAICLDDYEEGEKIRQLPCAHTYHCKCIDQWLTKSRGTCPVCKRKVFPNLRTDSDSDPESDNERTPLISETTPTTSRHGALLHTDQSTSGAVGGIVNVAVEDASSIASLKHTVVDVVILPAVSPPATTTLTSAPTTTAAPSAILTLTTSATLTSTTSATLTSTTSATLTPTTPATTLTPATTSTPATGESNDELVAVTTNGEKKPHFVDPASDTIERGAAGTDGALTQPDTDGALTDVHRAGTINGEIDGNSLVIEDSTAMTVLV